MRVDRCVAIGVGFVPTLLWIAIAVVERVEPAVVGGAAGPGGTQLIVYWSISSVPWVLGTWLAWRAWARTGSDADAPERLVAAAARALGRDRDEWGQAMRAELAGVDGKGPRWRFAIGCVWATVVAPSRGRLVVVACGISAAVLMGVGLIAYSRWSVVNSPSAGIVPYLILGPAAIAFVFSLVAASRARAFVAGLVTAIIGAVAGLPAMALAAVPETLHWYAVDTRALFDGEGGLPLGSQPDMLPGFLVVVVCFWLCFGVIGAAVGKGIGDSIRLPRPCDTSS